MIAHLLSVLGLLGVAVLLGASAYESFVIAPNLERDVPESIEAARRFFARTTAGHFFRVVAPLTQLLLFGSVVAAWPFGHARMDLLVAFGLCILTDVITYTFHFPRLAIMLRTPIPEDATALRRATREWGLGNHVRVVLLLVAFIAAMAGVLHIALHMMD